MKIKAGVACIVKHGAAAAALLFAAAAYAQDFSILYHERLGQWRIGPDTTKSSALRSEKPADDSLLSFTAFGRPFNVRLERNDVLLRRLPAQVVSSLRGVEVFRGELVDVPGSWARVTRYGAEITGVIFDGAELFAIDSPIQLAPYLRSREPGSFPGPIIYRWRDTAGALTDELGMPFDVATSSTAPAESVAASALDPGRQLDLGLVADTAFSTSAHAGSNAAASMLSRANIVDGIFIFQLGLHVDVAELTVLSQGPDPFTALEPSGLLDQLEEYRAATPAQRAQDLTHLLTGKNLAEPPSQSTQTVGIANLAAVCEERLGTSLTQGTFGAAVDALIMAHEFGHNFGAPHDGEPGACASEATTYIMARTVNHSQQFSACSIAQMQPWLVAPCLDVLAAGDVEVRFANAPPDAMMGEEFEVEVVVDNPSSSDAHGIEVTAAGSNLTVRQMTAASAEGFACQASASGPMCRRTVLPSRSSARLRVFATTTTSGPATLQVTVRAINDANTSNNIASHALAARPFVAMTVGFSPGPTVVRVGEAFEYVVTLRNAGNITGTNAIGRVNLWPGSLDVVGFSSDVGSCTHIHDGQYDCPLGTLPPGATRSLSLRFRGAGSIPAHAQQVGYMETGFSIDAFADQSYYRPGYGSGEVRLTLVDRVADLSTTVSPAAEYQTSSPVEFAITVQNLGPDSAREVRLYNYSAYLFEGLEGVTVTPSAGTCAFEDITATSPPRYFVCDIPELAVGQSLVTTVRGTATLVGQFPIEMRTTLREFDPDNANNAPRSTYTITQAITPPPPPTAPPPPPTSAESGGTSGAAAGSGDGGGGGAVGLLWLAALALALAVRLVIVPHGAQYSNRRHGGYTS